MATYSASPDLLGESPLWSVFSWEPTTVCPAAVTSGVDIRD